jgi:hypothetical protein
MSREQLESDFHAALMELTLERIKEGKVIHIEHDGLKVTFAPDCDLEDLENMINGA